MASLTFAVPPAVLVAGLIVDAAGLRAGLLMFAIGNGALAAYAVLGRSRRFV
jgi:hypothetical protein